MIFTDCKWHISALPMLTHLSALRFGSQNMPFSPHKNTFVN